MNKCIKIIMMGKFPESFFQSFIQKNARKLDLEGVVQRADEQEALIVVCGAKDSVDSFLDVIHKGTTSFTPERIEVLPFVKDKDYRGVFRVIE